MTGVKCRELILGRVGVCRVNKYAVMTGSMLPVTITSCVLYSLAVRTPGFNPGGLGLTPSVETVVLDVYSLVVDNVPVLR